MGLAFDEWDLNYYTDVFQNRLKRNPTNVECFDVAQSYCMLNDFATHFPTKGGWQQGLLSGPLRTIVKKIRIFAFVRPLEQISQMAPQKGQGFFPY